MPIRKSDLPKELVFWHMGLSFDAISSLQKPGYLKECQNVSLEIEGKQTLRQRFANINSTALGAIHSIKKWRTILIAGDTTHIRANADTGDFTDVYASMSGGICSFAPYKNFISIHNGTNSYLMDLSKNLYSTTIANPITAPTLTDKTSGSGPSGDYMGYVSYLLTFPNGHTYETGLSAASANLTIVDNTITWTSIPLCPYAATYGTEPTIHRKLYRGPGTAGTLGDIYYVATISDNTTQTYDDSLSDVTLSAADACYVDDYGPMPVPKYLVWHYGRAFIVDSANIHRLYHTEVVTGATAAENEVLMPIAYITDNWDDMRVSGYEYVDPQGLFSWGVNLYIALKDTWIRKQGNDPDTWAYRKTYAKYGIGAPYTVDFCSTPGGIIGVTNPAYGEPGIAVFGGQTSDLITSPKLDYIFNTDMNLDQIAKCRGRMAGRNYHLLYPSGIATEPDTYLCLDMRRFPDIRVAEWTDLAGYCIDTDYQGKKFYIGTSTGYAKTKASTGTSNILLETHDLIGGDPKVFNEQKTWTELKYSLIGTVTLQVYIDDDLLTWPDDTTSQTLTGTNEDKKVLKFPENAKSYKIRLKLTGTALSSIEIYSPWQLLFD